MSTIEWTDKTWNPVTGCTKISPGCAHCYAERQHRRLVNMGVEGYFDEFSNVTLQWHRLEEPLHWRKPRRVFVCSMSDLLHEDVPMHFIAQVLQTIRRCPHHQFQVLTKRPERLRDISGDVHQAGAGTGGAWPSNVWVGTSVENRKHGVPRIRKLVRNTKMRGMQPPAVRFLSIEPLLEDIGTIPLDGINWVIVGGESGPGARPMEADWVRNIRDQCLEMGIPFFFKQWGGKNKKAAGRTLDGRTWDEMPA